MEDLQQVEYREEIAELQRKLAELEETHAPAQLLEEYAAEVAVLSALLEAALRLRQQLQEDRNLSAELAMRGFRPEQFKEVYAFVYDAAMEIDLAGLAFAGEVERTDFSRLLRE